MRGNSKRKREKAKAAPPVPPVETLVAPVEMHSPQHGERTVRAAIDHIVDALPSDPEAEAAMDRAMAEKSTGTKRLLRVPVGPVPSEPMLAAPTPPLPFDEALRAFAEEIRPRIREAQKNDLSKYLKGTP